MTDNLLTADQTVEPKSYIEALTAPGAKFDKTKYASEAEMYEAIAKGKWEADKFIPIKNKAFDDLSADYIKLREEANAQASLKELIDQMSTNQQITPNTAVNEVRQPALDPAQLESLIDTRYKVNKTLEQEQSNFSQARNKLIERYGSEYQTVINKQLDELGMTPDEFNTMARKNPKLFERTFVPPAQVENFQSPPRSSRSTTFAPQGAEKRTWSYYQQMKKDNPREYSNPKTQLQLMDDYAALGQAFEDGDFHKFN